MIPFFLFNNQAHEKERSDSKMFNDISSRYDLLNHLLSLGIDFSWRRKFVRQLSRYTPKQVLDVATGTGDLAILVGSLATVQQVIGIDNASNMIIIAKDKVLQNKFNNKIVFRDGDAEAIPFPDGSFDAVTVAFGVRNYENLEKGLTEMRRVLRSGGVLMILEFSHPEAIPWKQLYGFYAKYIIPLIGRLVSKHKQAYTYLPESVSAFPSGKDFTKIL
jgi:demethylmenaquinone methyltransferase/2-methoxy-6-polyprenyl-1,4-benzoquinol methylase